MTLKIVFSTGDEFVSRLSEMLSCLEILGNESLVVTLPLNFLPHSFEEVSRLIRKPDKLNFAPCTYDCNSYEHVLDN